MVLRIQQLMPKYQIWNFLIVCDKYNNIKLPMQTTLLQLFLSGQKRIENMVLNPGLSNVLSLVEIRFEMYTFTFTFMFTCMLYARRSYGIPNVFADIFPNPFNTHFAAMSSYLVLLKRSAVFL